MAGVSPGMPPQQQFQGPVGMQMPPMQPGMAPQMPPMQSFMPPMPPAMPPQMPSATPLAQGPFAQPEFLQQQPGFPPQQQPGFPPQQQPGFPLQQQPGFPPQQQPGFPPQQQPGSFPQIPGQPQAHSLSGPPGFMQGLPNNSFQPGGAPPDMQPGMIMQPPMPLLQPPGAPGVPNMLPQQMQQVSPMQSQMSMPNGIAQMQPGLPQLRPPGPPPQMMPSGDEADMSRRLVKTRAVTREELLYEGRIIEGEARESIANLALAANAGVLTAVNYAANDQLPAPLSRDGFVSSAPPVVGADLNRDGIVDSFQRPQMMSVPVARNFIDTTGDGRANFMVAGGDVNRDGMIDVLQQPQTISAPYPSPPPAMMQPQQQFPQLGQMGSNQRIIPATTPAQPMQGSLPYTAMPPSPPTVPTMPVPNAGQMNSFQAAPGQPLAIPNQMAPFPGQQPMQMPMGMMPTTPGIA